MSSHRLYTTGARYLSASSMIRVGKCLVRADRAASSGVIQNEKQATAEEDLLFSRVSLELKGHDTGVLDSYVNFLCLAAQGLDIPFKVVPTSDKPIFNPFPARKSAHLQGKIKIHYAIRTYHRHFDITHVTGSTAETYLEYVQRNLPEGLGLKTTKYEMAKLPNYVSA